jgi:hypothetical protein
MYIVGEEEIEAVAEVLRSGKLFRYRARPVDRGKFDMDDAANAPVD